MKKPDIGKRLLPLLDIIFILLAFFIILPHGIKSNEIAENKFLKKKNKQVANKLEYYDWKYNALKKKSNKVYNILKLTLSSNKLYIGVESIKDSKWNHVIARKIEDENINFVIIAITDIAGQSTRLGTVRKLEKLLDTFKVIHIITFGDK